MKNYKLSDTLSNVLKSSVSIKGGELIYEMLKHYINEYTYIRKKRPEHKTNLASYIQNLVQDRIDTKISEEKNEKVSCRNGCSFCCYLSVEITNDEADLLIDYSKSNSISIDKEILEIQSNSKDFDNIEYQQRKCVFLSDKGSCMAYEVRPNACRKLISVSEPKLCDTLNNNGAMVKRLIDVEAEVIASSTINATTSDRLSTMILNQLNINK